MWFQSRDTIFTDVYSDKSWFLDEHNKYFSKHLEEHY